MIKNIVRTLIVATALLSASSSLAKKPAAKSVSSDAIPKHLFGKQIRCNIHIYRQSFPGSASLEHTHGEYTDETIWLTIVGSHQVRVDYSSILSDGVRSALYRNQAVILTGIPVTSTNRFGVKSKWTTMPMFDLEDNFFFAEYVSSLGWDQTIRHYGRC